MVLIRDILLVILQSVEKAAHIARQIRRENSLFELLIEEKKDGEKNQRFLHDFKTLADVLIQEMLRHDIAKEHPTLAANVQGEESNKFSNALGESVVVEVKEHVEETQRILAAVLDGRDDAARVLAAAVHSQFQVELGEFPALMVDIPEEKMAIWIDPIDGTAEYIHGTDDGVPDPETGIAVKGLHCATILVGVYLKESGTPILGVAHQPFYKRVQEADGSHRWIGEVFWAFNHDANSCVSPTLTHALAAANQQPAELRVLMSSSESNELQEKCRKHGRVLFAAAAGYKILCVVLGLVDVYAITRGSTFFWDVCSPHAILNAIGGGIIPFKGASKQHTPPQLVYHTSNATCDGADRYANSDGLIVYRNDAILQSFLDSLE